MCECVLCPRVHDTGQLAVRVESSKFGDWPVVGWVHEVCTDSMK